MTTVAEVPAVAGEVAVLREQGKAIRRVLHLNVAGLTQEESMIQPQPGGNCLNWNVGHLVWANEQLLGILGLPPVLGEAALKRYHRGTEPLTDAAEAMPLEKLMAAWDESWDRIESELAALTPERLAAPAPFSPRKNPDETVGTLLSIIFFHQASHTGQTSLLRRIAGKEGAIR